MKLLFENWRKHLNERTVNISTIVRKFQPELHVVISQFMEDYIINRNEVEGLEEVNQTRLITAMTEAAVSEVINSLGRLQQYDREEKEAARWEEIAGESNEE